MTQKLQQTFTDAEVHVEDVSGGCLPLFFNAISCSLASIPVMISAQRARAYASLIVRCSPALSIVLLMTSIQRARLRESRRSPLAARQLSLALVMS